MIVTVKFFKRADTPIYRFMFYLFGFEYSHVNVQIGNQDYFRNIQENIWKSAPVEPDAQYECEVDDEHYDRWGIQQSLVRRGWFHYIRYWLSAWTNYPNCSTFVSSLVLGRDIQHPDRLIEEIRNVRTVRPTKSTNDCASHG